MTIIDYKVTEISSIPSGSLHESDVYSGNLSTIQRGNMFFQNWVLKLYHISSYYISEYFGKVIIQPL